MPYQTLADSITNSLKSPFRRITSLHNPDINKLKEFWALKDVSFEVEQGEIIGIIGRNGAGKSTLLKILSRITSPTEGTIKIHGRVGSLLEVGTGFHSELTGRENIFLSGSILGMKKREIEERFDNIVKFSGIEKFIDTPVKRYSTGMHMRLAFAVAAHLDSEVLLIDEVLAVGDASFQKKCLGKMGDITHEGKTLLFVSHNLTAVKALCNRSIVLEEGRTKFIGDTDKAVDFYLKNNNLSYINNIPVAERKRESNCSLRAKILDIMVLSDNQKNPNIIDPFKPVVVYIKVDANSDVRCSAVLIISDEIQRYCVFDSSILHLQDISLKQGINIIECHMSPLTLFSGNYSIGVELNIYGAEQIDRVPDAYTFVIDECDPKKSGYNCKKGVSGIFYVDHEWKCS